MVLFELKRIFKEGIIIILILAALAIYTLTTDKDPYFASIVFMLFLLIYASFTGWSVFDRERQEGAEEYLFSMPVSRTRLFFLKFTPRLSVIEHELKPTFSLTVSLTIFASSICRTVGSSGTMYVIVPP